MSGLIVISGPPGVGKSTVASLVVENYNPSVLLAGDDFFGSLRGGKLDPWLPQAHEQNESVIAAAAAAAGRFAQSGYTTVFDGVVGPWFIDTFFEHAGINHLHYAILMAPVETCVARLGTRDHHPFGDEEATRNVHADFTRAVRSPANVIDAADSSASEIAANVRAAVDDGRIRYQA